MSRRHSRPGVDIKIKIYVEKLAHLTDEFREKIRSGTKDVDNMYEIERLWSELKRKYLFDVRRYPSAPFTLPSA
jgi:hypothetical protein